MGDRNQSCDQRIVCPGLRSSDTSMEVSTYTIRVRGVVLRFKYTARGMAFKALRSTGTSSSFPTRKQKPNAPTIASSARTVALLRSCPQGRDGNVTPLSPLILFGNGVGSPSVRWSYPTERRLGLCGNARVVKLVDTLDLGSSGVTRVGSRPVPGTIPVRTVETDFSSKSESFHFNLSLSQSHGIRKPSCFPNLTHHL